MDRTQLNLIRQARHMLAYRHACPSKRVLILAIIFPLRQRFRLHATAKLCIPDWIIQTDSLSQRWSSTRQMDHGGELGFGAKRGGGRG